MLEVHFDPRCQAMLEQIREAEMVQAIDRVRPIFNHRKVFVLNSLPLDLTVDRTLTWSELRPGKLREGICPVRGAAAFAGRSDPLFSGPVEVRERRERGREVVEKNRGRIPNRYIIWRNPPVFFGGAEGLLSAQRSARTAGLRTGPLGPSRPPRGA